jgi:hypothetical protein
LADDELRGRGGEDRLVGVPRGCRRRGRGLDRHEHLGELVTNDLEGSDCATELFAVVGVIAGEHEHAGERADDAVADRGACEGFGGAPPAGRVLVLGHDVERIGGAGDRDDAQRRIEAATRFHGQRVRGDESHSSRAGPVIDLDDEGAARLPSAQEEPVDLEMISASSRGRGRSGAREHDAGAGCSGAERVDVATEHVVE